jgi:hypothetical protein
MSPCILPHLLLLVGTTGLGLAGCNDAALVILYGWSAGALLGGARS